MLAQQVNNILNKLSELSLLNTFTSFSHSGDYLHLIYPTFTLLHYEALIEFCAEEELFFYSSPNNGTFQLTLLNDPLYDEE